MLDRVDQRANYLRNGHQPEPTRRFARGGPALEQPVHGDNQVRPAVSRAEHVPRPEDRAAEPGPIECALGLTARVLIRLHDRCGLRDAHVHEVDDGALPGRCDRFQRRAQVDVDELARFGWRRMRYADKLQKRVTRRDRVSERCVIERVTDDDLAAAGRFDLGAAPYERTNAMPARDERWNHMAP